jgi:UDP-N-acetylglucosamine 1-carboxyvinyltransferase
VERIVVRHSGPLHGSVPVPGAKNSVLKLMAATLLAPGRYRLTNVPTIADVGIMSDLLRAMGVATTGRAPGTIELTSTAEVTPVAPYELVERIRASINVLGPLLARCGRASVSFPGGDDFGTRPIDMHVRGLEALGVEIELRKGYLEARVDTLVGADITLEFPSVGATENILMAAVVAKGTTTIDNAAREPEIADLCTMLNAMGADIEGIGTSLLTVHGVDRDRLRPVEHRVVPDRLQAATYLAAVGVCGGEILVQGAVPEHMTMLLRRLTDMGMRLTPRADGLLAEAPERLRSIDVATLPYPGIATDYKPLLVTLLAVADGVGIVTENLYPGRFRYVDELLRLGADIRTNGHHAVVRGVPRLEGAPVRACDIRAGAALVVAGLRAEGETVISEVFHIDRGYEDLVGRLGALGASVSRSG